MNTKSLVAALVAVVALFLISNSLYIVKETERAVLLRFGAVVNPDIKPGLHAKIPFVNNVRIFDGRILTVDALPERFLTLEKKAVVVFSAETCEKTLVGLQKRISKSRRIGDAEIEDRLIISPSLPMMGDPVDQYEVSKIIEEHNLDVVVVDPLT